MNTTNDLKPSLLDARILLVDDDPGTVQALARMLAGYGQLRFATGGVEALHMLAGWVPELILLDAEMPGMSGFELFAALQADPRLAPVPVIFVTQHSEAEVEVAVFKLGAADFVTKPVTGPALCARVAMHLQLSRMASALMARPAPDGLTGIASRRQLDVQLTKEWARARRSGQALSLLLARVDHFRAFNESQGAAAGDACLRALAHLVGALAQRPGDLAARYSADEFALLLPDTDAPGATALAGRLTQALQALDLRHPASPLAARVTASIGVGTLQPRQDGDDGPAAAAAAAAAVVATDAAALGQAAQAALATARGGQGCRVALVATVATTPATTPATAAFTATPRAKHPRLGHGP